EGDGRAVRAADAGEGDGRRGNRAWPARGRGEGPGRGERPIGSEAGGGHGGSPRTVAGCSPSLEPGSTCAQSRASRRRRDRSTERTVTSVMAVYSRPVHERHDPD